MHPSLSEAPEHWILLLECPLLWIMALSGKAVSENGKLVFNAVCVVGGRPTWDRRNRAFELARAHKSCLCSMLLLTYSKTASDLRKQ